VPQVGSPEFDLLFGLSKEDIQKLLSLSLSKGGDFADLYFEYRVSNSVTMEEDILKSSSESISLGVGVRVLNGEQTGFGYTNDMTIESIKSAALTAAAIASGNVKVNFNSLNQIKPKLQIYDMKNLVSDKRLEDKIELVKRAYSAAKNYDSKISKVSASMADEIQYITIANSEGILVSDARPQVRLTAVATAELNGKRNTGFHSAGGRVGMDFYKTEITPEFIGRKSAEESIILLDAKDATPGEQSVVLSKDQSGVMIHEAVGHPLEADGAWKKTSIMAGKMGEIVANPLVTIYDDATMPNYRGSLNIDDEGTPTENVMLIEKGKLVGFLNDKLAAKVLNHKPNGHARRQSYNFPPIPRMNNTILQSGDTPPEDIIKSVKKGFYALTYQGGMVDSTGKFTFSV
ncbi:MAG: TldD/PmbA family protein, partial [Ignavibacteria bacterium]|nr:TldD/PmbA family protein [Ignavibacteria bacterium]